MIKVSRNRIALIIATVLVACIVIPYATSRKAKDNSTEISNSASSTISRIKSRGVILVGTTGDYRPLSFKEDDGSYWGFDIELAKALANELNVDVKFIPTSWPTLSSDVMSDTLLFDLAVCGITITDTRKETMLMSDGYLANGKTILCRVEDVGKFKSIDDIDKPEVKVMVNPGGTNEQFAKERLTHASVTVHQRNEEIPGLIAEGKADIMITEITEVPYYIMADSRLAAPLRETPFTDSYIGALMPKGQDDLMRIVNDLILKMKNDGSLKDLHEEYNLVYKF